MCKIILKYGDALTTKEISEHRESMEKGAGFAWFAGGDFKLTKNMIHQKAYDTYINHVGRSELHLFHSRWPSEGSVNFQNIQPFMTEDVLFCHNGTITNMSQLYYACMGKGIKFTPEMSDSFLLFRLVSNSPPDSAVTLLKSIEQNFVIAFKKRKEVHVIGKFIMEVSEDKTHVLSARNKYTGSKVHIITDFYGKVLYSEIEPDKYWHQPRFRMATEMEPID